MPYPSAQGPPGIPPRGTHSLFGTQLPYSPDGAMHCPCPHVTTVNSDKTEMNKIESYRIVSHHFECFNQELLSRAIVRQCVGWSTFSTIALNYEKINI